MSHVSPQSQEIGVMSSCRHDLIVGVAVVLDLEQWLRYDEDYQI